MKKTTTKIARASLLLLISITVTLVFDSSHGLHLDVHDEPSTIISQSKNFTVQANDTVVLPCVVRNLPTSKFAIWNQCDDPACQRLRFLLTVNKDNFVEDLRFRVINNNNKNKEESINVKRNNQFEIVDNLSPKTTAAPTKVDSWNLEIRKFSKADEGCYQCQLNTGSTFNMKTIHYCLKLQTKVITDLNKVTINVNEPIRLKCLSDEQVRLSHIKWFKNGLRIKSGSKHNNRSSYPIIEKNPPPPPQGNVNSNNINDANSNFMSTTLFIKHATLDDSGVYACKFGHLKEQIELNVVVSGAGGGGLNGANGSDRSIKSSEIRSSPDTFGNMGQSSSAVVMKQTSSLAFITIAIAIGVLFDPFY